MKRIALCGKEVRGNHVTLIKHQIDCEKCAEAFSRRWDGIVGESTTETETHTGTLSPHHDTIETGEQ